MLIHSADSLTAELSGIGGPGDGTSAALRRHAGCCHNINKIIDHVTNALVYHHAVLSLKNQCDVAEWRFTVTFMEDRYPMLPWQVCERLGSIYPRRTRSVKTLPLGILHLSLPRTEIFPLRDPRSIMNGRVGSLNRLDIKYLRSMRSR